MSTLLTIGFVNIHDTLMLMLLTLKQKGVTTWLISWTFSQKEKSWAHTQVKPYKWLINRDWQKICKMWQKYLHICNQTVYGCPWATNFIKYLSKINTITFQLPRHCLLYATTHKLHCTDELHPNILFKIKYSQKLRQIVSQAFYQLFAMKHEP